MHMTQNKIHDQNHIPKFIHKVREKSMNSSSYSSILKELAKI